MFLTAVFVRSVRPAALAFAASAFAVHTASGGGSIRELPCKDGVARWLVAVTPDGLVFAGYASTEVFRWTESGGFEALGSVYNLSPSSMSDDGGTIVSQRRVEGSNRWDAFRWTESGGTQSLGTWATDRRGLNSYFAFGVSGDGALVVGTGDGYLGATYTAFRWTESTGMVALGWLDQQGGSSPNSVAFATTPDGSMIVGECSGVVDGIDRFSNAVRWDAAGVAHALASQASWSGSSAGAVSADGSFIAGTVELFGGGRRAIRWDSAGNALDLGLFPGAESSVASGISGDGTVVVGGCLMVNGTFSAFVWSEATGILSLADFLLANGISTAGWEEFTDASNISRNGRVIIGSGVYRDFDGGCVTSSFIVDLGPACPADLDGNGAVTGFDLGVLLSQWGSAGSADLDGSGDVGGADLGLLLSAWGPCSGG